jgi:hypothetical protein
VSGPFLPLSSRRSVATSKDLTCVLNDFFLGSFLGVVVTHHTLQGLLRLGPQGSSGRKQKQHNARRSKVKQSGSGSGWGCWCTEPLDKWQKAQGKVCCPHALRRGHWRHFCGGHLGHRHTIAWKPPALLEPYLVTTAPYPAKDFACWRPLPPSMGTLIHTCPPLIASILQGSNCMHTIASHRCVLISTLWAWESGGS